MIGQQPNQTARAVREALNHPASVARAMALVLVAGIPSIAQAAGIEIYGGISGPVANDTALDYVWIYSGAVVNGDVTNTPTGTITAPAPGGSWLNAVVIERSSVNGALVNLGGIRSAGIGLATSFSHLAGGIRNEGTIQAEWRGIDVYGGEVNGGITNSGRIQSQDVGIDVSRGWWGRCLDWRTFSGGIHNSGAIDADGAGIVTFAFFSGGITNSGSINAGWAGIVRDADRNDWFPPGTPRSTFSGGIANSGSIQADLYGIAVYGAFDGGINNSGTIKVLGMPGVGPTSAQDNTEYSAWGILVSEYTSRVEPSTGFRGGIVNSGTIESAGGGIGISVGEGGWGDRFSGGITNSGTIASSVADGIGVYFDI